MNILEIKIMSGRTIVIPIIFWVCFICTFAQENVIRFHRADRQTIVRTHNDLRRSIYNAANMRELTWNHAVAHAAAEWAQKCEYISRPDNQWGQNMNYFYGRDADQSSIQLFQESFKGWSDDSERQQYDYRRFRYCGRKHVCSYVQLIAADVQEVGCAIVNCPRLQLREPEDIKKNAKLLVCFYTPWVNIVGNEVFIPQKRCDACPAGTTCVDNLCSARFGSSFSGNRRLPSLGSTSVKLKIEDKSGSLDTTQSQSRRYGQRKSNNRQENRDSTYSEHRRNPDTIVRHSVTGSSSSEDVYTPDNRVVPFPGREESRDIRHLSKLERRRQKQKARSGQAELVEGPVTVLEEGLDKNVTFYITNKTEDVNSRTKRQVDSRYYDVRYLRRLEYERYLRERQRLIKERYEEQRRRTEASRRLEEQRRLEEERRRRRRERQQSLRRAQALTLGEGELKGEEQFFIISAHNLLRQEVGARDLTWNARLERWARYVIRCDTEYPGPITCYTNFDKAEPGEDIHNVVYGWGNEGNDVRRPLRYGCRTPYDKSRCNHNVIIRNPVLTQMACAALKCGSQRQLTCIYNDA